jgi:hypothetical protein
VLTTTPRAAAGASGARHSLRPLISEGGTCTQNSRETRGEIAKLCLTVIASEAKQSTLAFLLPHGLLRFARNDDPNILTSRLFENESVVGQRVAPDTQRKAPPGRGEPDEAFVSGAPLRAPDNSFRTSAYSTT